MNCFHFLPSLLQCLFFGQYRFNHLDELFVENLSRTLLFIPVSVGSFSSYGLQKEILDILRFRTSAKWTRQLSSVFLPEKTLGNGVLWAVHFGGAVNTWGCLGSAFVPQIFLKAPVTRWCLCHVEGHFYDTTIWWRPEWRPCPRRFCSCRFQNWLPLSDRLLRCSAFKHATPLRLSSDILFRSNASRCAGGILAKASAAISDTVLKHLATRIAAHLCVPLFWFRLCCQTKSRCRTATCCGPHSSTAVSCFDTGHQHSASVCPRRMPPFPLSPLQSRRVSQMTSLYPGVYQVTELHD